ncbi:hypothetical protein SADUNF_Sadunf18G0040600 [Salix dunnii]|uniref:glycine dehydrogenase (aminomethyl-transferring) n=1 Tax=Salix dunnii TaxID=1413687 RepID=A0A835J5C3_9ROSI|nr:hypothetical protein SADUNF_Sadunf18G0040600 [Salix dunnii]
MERARRLANHAILKSLVNESKLSHNDARNESYLLNSSSSVSYILRAGYYGVGSQKRFVSVESFKPNDTFPRRHNSATPEEQTKMAELCGFDTFDSLIDATAPKSIRLDSMKLSKFGGGLTESQVIEHMKNLASKNKDRLESLLSYQTMITNLTGLPMSNASLLDEGTAAAEAMATCNNTLKGKKKAFIIANNCHYQTIDICKTRADVFNLKVVTADLKDIFYKSGDVCGVLVHYPGTEGEVLDYGEFIKNAHARGVKVVMASDLLALMMLKPPGELGADIVVGSAKRFGVPMGYGGPHAAFLATSREYKRMMPGRIIGVSVDCSGKPALRMAMQNREQHIRRDKATINICTAQEITVFLRNARINCPVFDDALLANMAAMYAVYHGPGSLKTIAQRVHGLAGAFAVGLKKLGVVEVQGLPFFDTLKVRCVDATANVDAAYKSEINLRIVDANTITVSFDEITTLEDVDKLFQVFAGGKPVSNALRLHVSNKKRFVSVESFKPNDNFPRRHNSATPEEQTKMAELCGFDTLDSLIDATVPKSIRLDSMKLSKFDGRYQTMITDLTGLPMSNAPLLDEGAAAAEALATFIADLKDIDYKSGDVCGVLVQCPGTEVGTDAKGNIIIEELRKAAGANKDNLSALMVTYPSTHGVYEKGIDEICEIIHDNGGQVYMDGANMNAQVGLTSPGFIGADVCHLNLHKKNCIPHGGGGPGMGPISVKKHLAPYLPSHPVNYYPILFRGVNGTVAHEFIVDLRGFKNTAGIEPEDVAKRLIDYGFHAPTMPWPVPGKLMIEPTESESKSSVMHLSPFGNKLQRLRKEKLISTISSLSGCANLMQGAPHPPSWEMHGQNHILGNVQPSLLLGSVLPSSGLAQVVFTTYMVTATLSEPFSQHHRLLKNRLQLPLLHFLIL